MTKPYSESEKLGASGLFVACLAIMGASITFSMWFQSWSFVVGASVFCVPTMLVSLSMARSDRWEDD